jgi:hypothetical protein
VNEEGKAMILRPYQKECAEAVVRAWLGTASTLVVMPTGTGKTVLFADLIRRSFPRRAMVLAHREELIWQACDKIKRVTGLHCEVEMGECRAEMGGLFGGPSVVVSTVQTHNAGGDGGGRMGKFDPRHFGLLIIDEAHHATSPSRAASSCAIRRLADARSPRSLGVLPSGATSTPVDLQCCLFLASRYTANQYRRFPFRLMLAIAQKKSLPPNCTPIAPHPHPVTVVLVVMIVCTQYTINQWNAQENKPKPTSPGIEQIERWVRFPYALPLQKPLQNPSFHHKAGAK